MQVAPHLHAVTLANRPSSRRSSYVPCRVPEPTRLCGLAVLVTQLGRPPARRRTAWKNGVSETPRGHLSRRCAIAVGDAANISVVVAQAGDSGCQPRCTASAKPEARGTNARSVRRRCGATRPYTPRAPASDSACHHSANPFVPVHRHTPRPHIRRDSECTRSEANRVSSKPPSRHLVRSHQEHPGCSTRQATPAT
jgi:hypothetical protein